jgi:hypothetical protein
MARPSRLAGPRYAVPTHLHAARGTITLPYIGRFTWRQFWWLLGAALVASLPWWLRLPLPAVVIWAGAVGVLGLVCAFVPINTRPFPLWLVVYARYLRRPRRAVWRPTPRRTAMAGHATFVRYAPRVQWLDDDRPPGRRASETTSAPAAAGFGLE